MDEHFQNVVSASLRAWKMSEGISDITVKPLVDLWGFGVKGKQPFPDPAMVKSH
jgi:thiamine biosynthesis lipoprotein